MNDDDDFDIDSALDAWADSFNGEEAKTTIAGHPQPPVETDGATAAPERPAPRPLTRSRPPRPAPRPLTRSVKHPSDRPTAPPPAPPPTSTPDDLLGSFPLFGEDHESTRIAQSPLDLIAQTKEPGSAERDLDELLAVFEGAKTRIASSHPPPAGPEPTRSSSAVIPDLSGYDSIDDLLFPDEALTAVRTLADLGLAPPDEDFELDIVFSEGSEPPEANDESAHDYLDDLVFGSPDDDVEPEGDVLTSRIDEPSTASPSFVNVDLVSVSVDATKLETSDEPELEIGDAPELETGAAPELEIGDAPALETGAAPELEIGDAPELEVGDAPELETGDAPELEIGDAPELEIGDAPELEIGDAPETGNAPELRTGDAPELETSDEPELNSGDAPEPSTVAETNEVPASEASSDSVDETTSSDAGAATAQRTVTRRKPRRESYALVGHSLDALRNRAELLKALADQNEDHRAGLMLARAELASQLGQGDEARTFTTSALELDPQNLVALRGARRDAQSQADWREVEVLLEKEISLPISPEDTHAAALMLAELRLAQLGDPSGAALAAKHAFDATGSMVAALVWARALRVDGDEEGAALALEAGAAGVGQSEDRSEQQLTAAMRNLAGRIHERSGEHTKASALYGHGQDLSSLLGQARVHSDLPTRAKSLIQASGGVSQGPLPELMKRLGAVMFLAADNVAAAADLLGAPTRSATHHLRARAAQISGNRPIRTESLEALAAATGGNTRALALVDLAELRAQAGDLPAAEQALRDAHLADGQLGTVQVVREVIARSSGDGERLALALDTGNTSRGAIEAAAKLVANNKAPEERRDHEREQLEHALEEGTSPLTADVLLFDVYAESGDDDAARQQLRRHAERATGPRRMGALLALASSAPSPATALGQARDIAPGVPVVNRSLARALRTTDPTEAAAVWLEAADASDGQWASHCATLAARVLISDGQIEEAHRAARRAFDSWQQESPATWLLRGDLGDGLMEEDRSFFLDTLADVEQSDHQSARVYACAALTTKSQGAWGRLLELEDDPLAREEWVSCSEISPGDRASALQKHVDKARDKGSKISDFDRMLVLRAGTLYEEAGDPNQAARLYRTLGQDDDAFVGQLLDRADLAAGSYARVSERRFVRVRAATPEGEATDNVDTNADTGGLLSALESLASVDLYERDSPPTAFLTLQSILEDAPGHIPTLRAVERYYMNEQRGADLAFIEFELAQHLPLSADVAAAARAAIELTGTSSEGLSKDQMASQIGARVVHEANTTTAAHRWIARRLLHADAAPKEVSASIRLLADAARLEERGPIYLSGLDALKATEGVEGAAAILESVEQDGHVLLSETRGALLYEAEAYLESATAYQRAVDVANDSEHRLRLYYLIAKSWQRAGEQDREMTALEQAAKIDITHEDVFDRLREYYQDCGATEKLANLAASRVSAGADGATLLSLQETQAKLKLKLGLRDEAKDALRQVLALKPDHTDGLKELATLCLEDSEWIEAADALVRFARLRQQREELRWVFFNLGRIYDLHLPDPRRAEAAYRRVLKLSPDDLEALEALSTFYVRAENWQGAIVAYQQLYKSEIDPDAKVQHIIALSRAYEDSGDRRRAEQTLDFVRRKTPGDLQILGAMADLYRRQNAAPALSMHLSRAAADFRRLTESAPGDAAGWTGLATTLEWHGYDDACNVTAHAASALGIKLQGRPAPKPILGGGSRATEGSLEELVAPTLLTPAIFDVFRQASETLGKMMPFEARAWRAHRAGRDRDALRAQVEEIATWFDQSGIQLLISEGSPHACFSAGMDPLTLVVGQTLADEATEAELAFLIARAFEVETCHFGIVFRNAPDQLALYLAALVRLYDADYQPEGVDVEALEAASRKLARTIPRSLREELGPVVVEMGGTGGFTGEHLVEAVTELGNRTALLALADIPSALSAVFRAYGTDMPSTSGERVALFEQIPEAQSLLRFATSDEHFGLRRRIGTDR